MITKTCQLCTREYEAVDNRSKVCKNCRAEWEKKLAEKRKEHYANSCRMIRGKQKVRRVQTPEEEAFRMTYEVQQQRRIEEEIELLHKNGLRIDSPAYLCDKVLR